MNLSKGDLVHKIRIGNGQTPLKGIIGIVIRDPYETIFKISQNPPISECFLVVDLLIENKVYLKVPIKNMTKVKQQP